MDRSHHHCSGHSVYGSDHLGDMAAEQTLKTWNFEMTLRLFESSRKAVLIGTLFKKIRRGRVTTYYVKIFRLRFRRVGFECPIPYVRLV
jgi:hypothetical protein